MSLLDSPTVRELQVWFRFKASNSGIAMSGSLIGQILGMMSAGIVLSKIRPKAVYVCMWNVFAALFVIFGLYAVSSTYCDRSPWLLKEGTTSR